ncbi:hypothetical protein BCR39DRAFT_528539 [Naematelia encephala]|uniref:Uncharacterized protein n=1 Tax=Naematelia encephala TaxID=71784 RepID=A0A1Y2B7V7_9TREE|nr:hypothetical protein BCR39DRAFT_528539 [Naematelia encephala]
MFPVPSHLPRTGGEALSSDSDQIKSPPDPVLDLLSPLLSSVSESQPTGFSVQQVSGIRNDLQKAVDENKARAHELLISNLPSISSHIRLGAESQGNFSDIRDAVETLESQIDATSTQASFIPPILSLLKRHFDAVETKSRAKAHLGALQGLKSRAETLAKLEAAISEGRGADGWVIEELEALETGFETLDGYEILQGTKILHASQARIRLLKPMLVEQVGDGFDKAVAFSSSSDGPVASTLTVSDTVALPRPRTFTSSVSSTSDPETKTYSLPYIYEVLHRLGNLSSILTSLRQRLLRDLIHPLLSEPSYRSIVESTAGPVATLRLERCESPREADEILQDIFITLQFVDSTVFPILASPLHERDAFIDDIRTSVLQAVLEHLILPSIPPDYNGVASWLEVVKRAVQCEKDVGVAVDLRIVEPFFTSRAGTAWASQRRQVISEQVRRLVTGGWAGWEAVEIEHEKEINVVVEVEVDEHEPAHNKPKNGSTLAQLLIGDPSTESFGWGFEDDGKDSSAPAKPDQRMDVDGGWEFDDTITAEAGPSRPRQPTPELLEPKESAIDDGWDFEVPTNPVPAPAPAPIPPSKPKPAREAKRLGKKVAKVKSVVDDDPWGSGTESVASSSKPVNGHEPDPQPSRSTSQDDGWGWDEDAGQSQGPPIPLAAPEQVKKPKKKILKEQKRLLKETFLVSVACSKLLEIAEAALREGSEVAAADLRSPSFQNVNAVLYKAATDVFDLYRSLIPAVFANQLRDVPTISMQSYNDCLHLNDAVLELAKRYPAWPQADDVARRLLAAGEHAFEMQLVAQRDGLLELLDETAGFVEMSDERRYRICEKSIEQVAHNLESLAKVFKLVLPIGTSLDVLGYLLDTVVSKVSSDLLALEDITEIESNRLNDLIKLLMPLESIFLIDPTQPSTVVAQVPHWLKLCYISELLQANLVDITYLFETGALVDFTTDELVRMIRALFANSVKRDEAIEKIEAGRLEVQQA